MHAQVQALALVVVVAFVYALARRVGALPPLLLVLVGLVASFVPGVPEYSLDPSVVLTLFLPPLLYAAAIQTSLPGFRANLRPIGLLAVGCVLFTTAVVAVVAHAAVPGLPWAAAFALGAIVAPPDAVAATAVARKAGLPRRVVTILEGESLVNDATALTALRVAAGAVTAATSWPHAVLELVVSAVGGAVVGLLTATFVTWLRRRTTDTVLDSTVSLLTPFAAYAAAESWASGVLAVVVAGLLLGHRSPLLQSPQSRLQQASLWRMIEFLLQGVLFALLGLQLAPVLRGLDEDAGVAVRASVLVALAVVLTRPLWVFPGTYLPRLVPRIARTEPPVPWQSPVVISWAGMRGAVSLAAALSLDEHFPHRRLVIVITFVVIGTTLLLQGSTLPLVIRRSGLQPADPTQDVLAEAAVKQRAARAAEAELDLAVGETDLPHGVEDRLRAGARHRALAAWERLGGGPGGSGQGDAPTERPSDAFKRVRRRMLDAERRVLVTARDEGHIDEEVMRAILRDLDLEEAMLSRDEGE
ncbi:sodium/proton antiporter (CPA1 family) [Motilibacter rhizosphaerae]|uniref:Sodium/proton antiporter (CPA1 family) n=1 Tax=Motilibacter rhizosphaerae TaxID=598652 RepID=A0A4Q7NPI8_9ACTN|nr:Na+/H+ antiporter [Motilibacter rhizosphaerae]RZS87093.1 sodium/proton antiporter (CPA1 family) [Motilibacter rhizosphaerae]